MFRGPVIISALLTTTDSVRRGGGASSYVYLKVYRHDGRAAEPNQGLAYTYARPDSDACSRSVLISATVHTSRHISIGPSERAQHMISLGKTERCGMGHVRQRVHVPLRRPYPLHLRHGQLTGFSSDPFAQQLLPEIIRQLCRLAALAMIPATARLLVVLLPFPKPLDVERQVLELRAPRRARVLQLPAREMMKSNMLRRRFFQEKVRPK
jgi:hypothetical protein